MVMKRQLKYETPEAALYVSEAAEFSRQFPALPVRLTATSSMSATDATIKRSDPLPAQFQTAASELQSGIVNDGVQWCYTGLLLVVPIKAIAENMSGASGDATTTQGGFHPLTFEHLLPTVCAALPERFKEANAYSTGIIASLIVRLRASSVAGIMIKGMTEYAGKQCGDEDDGSEVKENRRKRCRGGADPQGPPFSVKQQKVGRMRVTTITSSLQWEHIVDPSIGGGFQVLEAADVLLRAQVAQLLGQRVAEAGWGPAAAPTTTTTSTAEGNNADCRRYDPKVLGREYRRLLTHELRLVHPQPACQYTSTTVTLHVPVEAPSPLHVPVYSITHQSPDGTTTRRRVQWKELSLVDGGLKLFAGQGRDMELAHRRLRAVRNDAFPSDEAAAALAEVSSLRREVLSSTGWEGRYLRVLPVSGYTWAPLAEHLGIECWSS